MLIPFGLILELGELPFFCRHVWQAYWASIRKQFNFISSNNQIIVGIWQHTNWNQLEYHDGFFKSKIC